mgnify:CR=1 FL=1
MHTKALKNTNLVHERMKITKEVLLSVEKNCRLELTPEEQEEFLPQLQEIITFFEKIEELPATTISIHPKPIVNEWRDDVVAPSLSQEDALKNVKFSSRGFIRGPKTQ